MALDEKKLKRILKAQKTINRDFQKRLDSVYRELLSFRNSLPEEDTARFDKLISDCREIKEDYDDDILDTIFSSYLSLLDKSKVLEFLQNANLLKMLFRGF